MRRGNAEVSKGKTVWAVLSRGRRNRIRIAADSCQKTCRTAGLPCWRRHRGDWSGWSGSASTRTAELHISSTPANLWTLSDQMKNISESGSGDLGQNLCIEIGRAHV